MNGFAVLCFSYGEVMIVSQVMIASQVIGAKSETLVLYLSNMAKYFVNIKQLILNY